MWGLGLKGFGVWGLSGFGVVRLSSLGCGASGLIRAPI